MHCLTCNNPIKKNYISELRNFRKSTQQISIFTKLRHKNVEVELLYYANNSIWVCLFSWKVFIWNRDFYLDWNTELYSTNVEYEGIL